MSGVVEDSTRPGVDRRPPRSLVPRPEQDAAETARRVDEAVVALERVRTQLDRTQRTLDAFVSQVTGTHGDMRPAPAPPAPAAPAPTRAPGSTPPDVAPPAPDPPTAAVPGATPPAASLPPAAPSARTPPTAPASSSSARAVGPQRAAPPARRPGAPPPEQIADHVLPGRHPSADVGDVAAAEDEDAATATPGRRTAWSPPGRWTRLAEGNGTE